MSLTAASITAALKAAGAGSGLVMPADQIAGAFNDAMLTYGGGLFNTPAKVAALVSECMMESAYFRTTEEYRKDGRYAPYIGRTFMQLTWQTNYAKFGAWCKKLGLISDANTFVTTPKSLADLKWSALGGVWYFTQVQFAKGPLVNYADDILAVGRAVNLGSPTSTHTPAGQSARTAAYKAVLALGSSIVPVAPKPAPAPTPTPTPEVPDVAISDTDAAKIADAVLSRDGKIPNTFTGNPKNEYVALATALEAIGKQLDEISAALAALKK